jgi:hypothetical protein
MATQQNSSGRIGGRLTCRATGRALRSILLGGALRAFGDRETDDQHDDAGDKNETQEAATGAMSQNYGQIIHDFAFRFRFPGEGGLSFHRPIRGRAGYLAKFLQGRRKWFAKENFVTWRRSGASPSTVGNIKADVYRTFSLFSTPFGAQRRIYL